MRQIDADKLRDAIIEKEGQLDRKFQPFSSGMYNFLRELVDAAPTINPADLVPKGRWNGEGDGYADGEIVLDVWYCSECNHCIDDGTDEPDLLPKFCPNCGARMVDDEN